MILPSCTPPPAESCNRTGITLPNRNHHPKPESSTHVRNDERQRINPASRPIQQSLHNPARRTALLLMPYSLIALMLAAVPLAAADWPHWRGPARDGRTDEPSRWADGRWLPDQPAWTANVGSGASSPLVIGDRVYCLGRTGGRDVIRCLSTKDGKELWSAGYRGPEYGRFHNGDEGLYSGPSSTPEYDPETKLLYTLGPDGDLRSWATAADSKADS